MVLNNGGKVLVRKLKDEKCDLLNMECKLLVTILFIIIFSYFYDCYLFGKYISKLCLTSISCYRLAQLVHVEILPFWEQQVVGLSDSTFNQE